jgi:hypothetical protein
MACSLLVLPKTRPAVSNPLVLKKDLRVVMVVNFKDFSKLKTYFKISWQLSAFYVKKVKKA